MNSESGARRDPAEGARTRGNGTGRGWGTHARRRTGGPTRIGLRVALRAVLGSGALSIALAAPAAAQTIPFDEIRSLGPQAAVELRVVDHSLVVERWDRNEIQFTGEYESGWEELVIGGDEAAVRFEIRPDPQVRNRNRPGPARVVVRVPAGVRLTAWTVSGSAQVTGLTGSITAQSVSGAVTLEGNVEGASLQTVSGSARYHGDTRTLRMTSVSGGVEYRGLADEVRLNSVSGSVRMEGGGEIVNANSVSGRVEVTSTVPVRSAEIGSVSGVVAFTGRLAPGGSLQVESHSGRAEVALGADTEARFELTTFSGRIEVEFPGARDEVRSESRFTPNRTVSFVTGAAAGRVEVRSFSGTVRVRAEGE